MKTICVRNKLPFRRVANLSVIHIGEQRVLLNQTGTAIWELLDGRRSNYDIADVLRSNESAESVADLAERVARFLDVLRESGLTEALDPRQQTAQPDVQSSALCSDNRVSQPIDSARATSQAAPQGSLGNSRNPRVLEEKLHEVYWSNCYIEKMHLELTYRCNCRCVQCYNTTHGGAAAELTLTEWTDTLSQLAELCCHTITFTGGEVFVRKDVLDILSAACGAGFSFQINTNGSLITSSTLRSMESMRPFLRSFDISFFGATAPIHDALARRSGSYDATMRAVMLLKEGNWPLVAKFITMKDNFEGVAQWQREMAKIGVRHVIAPGILIPRTNRDASPMKQALTTDQLEKLMRIQPEWESSTEPPCRPGHVRGCITPDGKVSPCEWLTQFELGNLRQHSLREIWFSPTSLAFRGVFDNGSECSTCKLRTTCARCPARCYLETGNLLGCAPTARRIAEIHMQPRSVQ